MVWIDDPANESPQSLRARTRKHLREKPMEAQAPEGETSLTAAQLQALLHLPEMLIPFGMVAFRAEAFDALPRKTALKLLATAAVCAGGGDKLPGREKVAALLENLSSGKPLTLAGTRVCRREDVITLSREAGDIGRNRPGTLSISETGEAVWDGRFAVRSSQPGNRSLRSFTRRFAGKRQSLADAPAGGYPPKPAGFCVDDSKDNQNKCLLTNPALRQSDYKVIETRCLVGSRLRAALGLITTESDLVRAKND